VSTLTYRMFALLVLLFSAGAWGDYLEVRRPALVKFEPDKSSKTILKVESGTTLPLLRDSQRNGYYEVGVAADEGKGWVFRNYVRRFPGEIPDEQPAAEPGVAPTAGPASTDATTGTFHGCPPEGKGGDPILNRLKNRDLPPAVYHEMTVSELIEEIPDEAAAMGRKSRSKWTPEALKEVAAMEAKGARIEGYLLKIKKEGKESCNCGSETDVDHHLWLGEEADAPRSESVVVEISPRLLPAHPKWTVKNINQVIKNHEKVRISGWLTWDQEHPEQLGNTRGTLWEIHPIHQIEVEKDGHWVPLDDLQIGLALPLPWIGEESAGRCMTVDAAA
jgi:hypothetical protein